MNQSYSLLNALIAAPKYTSCFHSGLGYDEPRARGNCPRLLRPSPGEAAQRWAGPGPVGLDRGEDESLHRRLPTGGRSLSGNMITEHAIHHHHHIVYQ